MATLCKWINSLFRLLFPHRCVVCNNLLTDDEKVLCQSCNLHLPRTDLHLQKDNEVEKLLWGKIDIERATSYFYYTKGSGYRQVLHQLKYEGRKDIAQAMGFMVGQELANDGFFQSIDLIIPIPLHRRKQRSRGYNQSQEIGKGISRATGIRMETTCVVRLRNTTSQTNKSTYERWENVSGIFVLRHPERLENQHILLLDDVMTTGATITACADALKSVPGIRISVLTLALAGK